MTIEGVAVPGINGLSTAINKFLISNDDPVTVADGKLTVVIGGGALASVINYIRIRPR